MGTQYSPKEESGKHSQTGTHWFSCADRPRRQYIYLSHLTWKRCTNLFIWLLLFAMYTSILLHLLFKRLRITKVLLLFQCLVNGMYTFSTTDGTILPSPGHINGMFSKNGYSEWWIPSTFPTAIASNISEQCITHTREYLTALRNHVPWALQSKFDIRRQNSFL